MKTGIIVHIVNYVPCNDDFDEKRAVRNLDVKADVVDFIYAGDKEDDIAYSWWRMTVKGMSRIVCMTGEMIAPSFVRLIGRELQLSAY